MINAKGCGQRNNLSIGLYAYPSKRNYNVFQLFFYFPHFLYLFPSTKTHPISDQHQKSRNIYPTKKTYHKVRAVCVLSVITASTHTNHKIPIN